MTSPEPYGKDTLNNSPLAADGSDFPCKLRQGSFQAPSHENVYHIGDNQTVRLIGSATHGGGSCQISLTTDLEPSKNSKWNVIKSFEGGCPSDVSRNLNGMWNTDHDLELPFTIPEGIQPGKYTLAWTWFNKLGNREMYMNCAPITVTNAPLDPPSRNVADAPAFPSMFVANINGCMTTEGVDISFPEPGNFVESKRQVEKRPEESGPVCVGFPRFGGSAASESAKPVMATAYIPKTNSGPTSKFCKCGCHSLYPTIAARSRKSTS
ncbi:hypothetical protein N7481_010162 [Penicillium waksmanii]|uniref:uncharacterized protein n=1 Tax=Penicillium waksmanii TaxID=69791 RepID=UPI002549C137|nr:uncharacterized protein N7481_010162 [Penicillium waksmanii]KAJ5976455.1 hypothetical protein N7481_010162 [Penicillium waksmanii]